MTGVPVKTFVFIPGAGLGGWSWFPVARLLRERGHQVMTLTLPGLSYGSSPISLTLTDAIDFIVEQVQTRDLRDIVLVSHSWGGYPATGAAYRLAERIATVVYYNAVVPARGESMADENAQYGQAIRELIATRADQSVPFPVEAIRQGLMQDESVEAQDLVFSLMLPTPGGYMTGALDLDGVTEIGLSAAYLLGVDDISLARPGAEFAARIGLTPILVPGSHMAMLTKPAPIADALAEFA